MWMRPKYLMDICKVTTLPSLASSPSLLLTAGQQTNTTSAAFSGKNTYFTYKSTVGGVADVLQSAKERIQFIYLFIICIVVCKVYTTDR